MNKYNLDKRLLIRLPDAVLENFKKACYKDYKSLSEVIRGLIQQYIKDHEVEDETKSS